MTSCSASSSASVAAVVAAAPLPLLAAAWMARADFVASPADRDPK
jgi:hypothetical protein